MELFNNIPDDFENLEKYAPTLAKVRKENCFTVPEGYFDELPEAIRIETIASQFSKENPFDVPADYFEDMAIEIEASAFASGLAKENKFKIPANYFDELPQEIETKIITASFPKENPFDVPADYFDHLPTLIQEKIAAQGHKVKVLTLDWFNKTQLIAIAASLVIVCTIGINYWNRSNNITKTEIANTIKSPEKTLEEHMQTIDESTLEDALAEENGESGTAKANEEVASNEKIVNYLIDDNIDVATLTNELKENKK